MGPGFLQTAGILIVAVSVLGVAFILRVDQMPRRGIAQFD